MKKYILTNDKNVVVSMLESHSEQPDWHEVEYFPHDLETNMRDYKFSDGRFISKAEQENVQLKIELDEQKEAFETKLEFLELSILDIADLSMGGEEE